MADFSHIKVIELPTSYGRSKIVTECSGQSGFCHNWAYSRESNRSIAWTCLNCKSVNSGCPARLLTSLFTPGAPIRCMTDPDNPAYTPHRCSGPTKLVSALARGTEQKMRLFLESEGGDPLTVFRDRVDAAVLCLPEDMRSEFRQEIRPFRMLKRGFSGALNRFKEKREKGTNWHQNEVGLSSLLLKTLLTTPSANTDGHSPVCDLAKQCEGSEQTASNHGNDPDYVDTDNNDPVLCKLSPKTRELRRPVRDISCDYLEQSDVSDDGDNVELLVKNEKVVVANYRDQNGVQVEEEEPQSKIAKFVPTMPASLVVESPAVSSCVDCRAKDESLLSMKKCLESQTILFDNLNGLISDLRSEIEDVKSKRGSHVVKNV